MRASKQASKQASRRTPNRARHTRTPTPLLGARWPRAADDHAHRTHHSTPDLVVSTHATDTWSLQTHTHTHTHTSRLPGHAHTLPTRPTSTPATTSSTTGAMYKAACTPREPCNYTPHTRLQEPRATLAAWWFGPSTNCARRMHTHAQACARSKPGVAVPCGILKQSSHQRGGRGGGAHTHAHTHDVGTQHQNRPTHVCGAADAALRGEHAHAVRH
jgi:hypothetical protein